ncbi:MAG: alpha/beta fold hydrolase [Streptosporangiaceae bacterium]
MPPSQWADIGGLVHYVDYGGPENGPRLVLLHGLGGSLLSWAAVAPALARTGRVIAFDLPGFGRTPGSPRPVTLDANKVLLRRFLAQVAGEPAIVVGHSMGATIAAMLSAEHAASTAGLVLVDPAVPWQFEGSGGGLRLSDLVSGLVQKAATPGQASQQGRVILEQALRLAQTGYERASQIQAQGIERNLAAIRARLDNGEMNSDMLAAARSLTLTVGRRRQFAAMLGRISVPVLMLHGDRDRFVPIGAARATALANPAWQFEVAKGIGHVPQLEDPEWTTARILSWISAEGAEATRVARGARTSGRLPADTGNVIAGTAEEDDRPTLRKGHVGR